MKRKQLVFMTAFVGFILLLEVGCQQQTGKVATVEPVAELLTQTKQFSPEITFEKTVHDFGELGVKEKAECEFRFLSTGEAVLEIGKIRSSCGCTVPSLSKKEYKPGEDGVIRVKYSGRGKPGHVVRHISVETNDSENAKVKLMIKARVVQQIEVTPSKLELSLGKGSEAVPRIVIKTKDGSTFSIKSFSATNGLIRADFDPESVASEFVLEPEADLQKLKKYSRGNVRIGLTHPGSSLVTLPYEVVAKFQARPGRIVLHKVQPGKPQVKEIMIKSANSEQFEIESVSSKLGYVKVISQEANGDNIKLKLQITPPTRKAEEKLFNDSVNIRIKNEESLMINCTGFYGRTALGVKPEGSPKNNIEPEVSKKNISP